MKKLTLAALIALMPASAIAEAAHGMWASERNEEGNWIEVNIQPCAGDAALTCGTIARAMSATGENTEYEHTGRMIIEDMEVLDATRYANGTIWAPDDDKTYKSNMQVNGDTLTVKGCVLFICRGQDWTRVN
ncbi:uncharacterized protein (DUF2147 family) [Rubricella aquisinus]|uniref:Uncharacterized protein (DUF2147 family) n=1 Tax=Rubricella aquisinus TaxID=2028108 RepID=A0A840X053_9RHOB|nr:DUF2147 domain-containing protein [Rubricella aquisinus]MBB5516780.1 uncharacterized protein (DUF2147 family) [Rubricella aquisinus]